jgi:hypothetical protein
VSIAADFREAAGTDIHQTQLEPSFRQRVATRSPSAAPLTQP